MATRQIRTTGEDIQRASSRRPVERTRQAFLASAFPGTSQQVHIQFTDPTRSRGALQRASVRAGLSTASLPAGTPVTVIIRHGKIEVVGIPNPAPSDATGIEAAIVTRAATQSIPNNAVTALLFDTNLRITESDFHSTTADQEKFYAPWEGWYHVEGYALFANFATGGRCIIYVADSTGLVIAAIRTDPAASSNFPYISISADVYLVAADWVGISVFQNSGASVNITFARGTIRYLGA